MSFNYSLHHSGRTFKNENSISPNTSGEEIGRLQEYGNRKRDLASITF